eukprot:8882551-Alexandrium_andersonii.AAC.1
MGGAGCATRPPPPHYAPRPCETALRGEEGAARFAGVPRGIIDWRGLHAVPNPAPSPTTHQASHGYGTAWFAMEAIIGRSS